MLGGYNMDNKILEALNKQLNAEIYASHLYLSMAGYFESRVLKGFGHWMRLQAAEEKEHAMKIFNHLLERGQKPLLSNIEGPPVEWKNPLQAMEAALEHEKKVTGMINDIVNLAESEKDHATRVFLDWFVTEQIEEEDQAGEIVEKLKIAGDNKGALFVIDGFLGKRKE